MRIPKDHYLLRQYIKDFGLKGDLFDFQMENKFIYLSGMPQGKMTMVYHDFDTKLKQQSDPDLMALFPGLKLEERVKIVMISLMLQLSQSRNYGARCTRRI